MRGRDRISDLPDSILHHIFSFLNIGHAVHASILSKRWRNFWKSLSYLDFIDDHRPNVDFVDRVNKVLILREKLDVLRFRVDSEDRAVARHIYSWILAAIQSNVREIYLNVVARCKLPGYLFSCKTLTVLKVAFDHCEHKLPLPSSGPPNLKVLHLKACRLPSAEVTSKFISGCFSLEHLELDYIELESGKKYRISNAKLESLVIRNPYIFADDSNCKFEICAANLKAFTCLVVMETEILFEPLPLLNLLILTLKLRTLV
ncbi:hypothetical protein Syun_010484 [Stephania yunnanensis]|uniref:F-box domain-containing protein n=1 Tax=Stephania yunnanensis TaxID=152371 RepID=A0AAP0KJ71_9MAGN